MKQLLCFLTIAFIMAGFSESFAQRKDSDAKVSIYYYTKMCQNRRKLGNAELRVLYAFNADDIKDKSTWIDEGQLKITKGMTQYSSHFEEVNEDSLAQWFREHTVYDAYPPLRWLQGHKPERWIEYQYSNIKVMNGILEEWAAMPREIDNENMVYSEPFPLQKWKIENEKKTICGYECQKATCKWRGRDFVAWFTTQIPVSAGPWKFGGLPGLILEIRDSKNDYSWEAVAVEKGNFPIYAARRKGYKKSTRKEVQKLQKDLNVDYLKTTDHTVFNIKSNRYVDSRVHPYTPLELE